MVTRYSFPHFFYLFFLLNYVRFLLFVVLIPDIFSVMELLYHFCFPVVQYL